MLNTRRFRVLRAFKYAFEGHRVVEYTPGVCELPDEVADVALLEKWAEPAKAGTETPAPTSKPGAAKGGARKGATSQPGAAKGGTTPVTPESPPAGEA